MFESLNVWKNCSVIFDLKLPSKSSSSGRQLISQMKQSIKIVTVSSKGTWCNASINLSCRFELNFNPQAFGMGLWAISEINFKPSLRIYDIVLYSRDENQARVCLHLEELFEIVSKIVVVLSLSITISRRLDMSLSHFNIIAGEFRKLAI